MAEAMETEMDFSDGEQANNANRASLVALYGSSSVRLEKGIEPQQQMLLPGYIFMCNGRTKQDCFRYRVFGIPRGGKSVVERIRPGMKLFLYDFEKRLLYGVYEATVGGKMDIEPEAFDNKYPAQVGFRIVENCYPLPESTFKSAIYENYKGGKFNQELAPHQVGSLLSLFRPFAAPQLDALPHRFASGASAASRELSFEERFIAATQLKKASSVLDHPLSAARHAEPRLGSLSARSHLLHHSYSGQDGYTATPVRETPSRSSSIQDPQLKYLSILSNIRRYGTAPEPLSSENEYHPAAPSEKDQFASPYSDKKHYLSTLPGSDHSSASAANGNLYRGELYTSASQKEGEASQQHQTLTGTYYHHSEASTVPYTTASMQAVNPATAGYPTQAHGEAPQLAAGSNDYAYKPQTVTGNYTTTHLQPGSVGEHAESYTGAVSYPPQQHSQLYAGGPGYTQQPHETAYAQQHYSAATGYAQQNHAASTGYALRPQTATTGYAQQAQDAASGYAQQSQDAATGYAQQSYDASTGYAQQPHAAATGYAQQLQDAATGYAQQLQDAATGYAQQPQDAAAGYAQQPYGQAAGYTAQQHAQALGYTTQPYGEAVGYTTQPHAQAVGYTPQYSAAQAGAYSQQAVTQGSIPGAPRTTDWNAASQAYAASQAFTATGDWNAMNQSYYHHTADTTTT